MSRGALLLAALALASYTTATATQPARDVMREHEHGDPKSSQPVRPGGSRLRPIAATTRAGGRLGRSRPALGADQLGEPLPPAAFGEEDKFPNGFAFGVAASAFQIEGDGGGRPRSVWDDFADQHRLGDEARAGIRFYEHFAGDVDYMARLGVRHFRLSLSWPRLMRADLTPIEEGYAYYGELLDAMAAKGIEPFVTLFHWDLPSFLCERGQRANDASLGAVDDASPESYGGLCAGAWLDPGIIPTFATYAKQAFERLGGRVKHWATLNEPKTVVNLGYGTGEHAPGIRSSTAPLVAAHNMLLAHAEAVKVYRETFQPSQGGWVSLVVNCDWREPWDPNSAADVAAAKRAMEEEMGWFAEPLYTGHYPNSMRERLGDDLPRFNPEQSAALKGSVDYFALNHYTSRYVKAASLSDENSYVGRPVDWEETDIAMDGTAIGPVASLLWLRQVPWGIRKTLQYVKDRYGNPPTYVTENGMSFEAPAGAPLEEQLNDVERVNFIGGYLKEVLAAVKSGCNVRGYFHWSIFDNFEWADGTRPRFGLVLVDYNGTYGGGEWMKRRAKKSLGFYQEFMAGKHSEGAQMPVASLGMAPKKASSTSFTLAALGDAADDREAKREAVRGEAEQAVAETDGAPKTVKTAEDEEERLRAFAALRSEAIAALQPDLEALEQDKRRLGIEASLGRNPAKVQSYAASPMDVLQRHAKTEEENVTATAKVETRARETGAPSYPPDRKGSEVKTVTVGMEKHGAHQRTVSTRKGHKTEPVSTVATERGTGHALAHGRRRRGEEASGVGWSALALRMWWVSAGPAAVAAAAGVVAGFLLIAVQVSCNSLVKRNGGDVNRAARAGSTQAVLQGRRGNTPENRGLMSQGTAPSYGI